MVIDYTRTSGRAELMEKVDSTQPKGMFSLANSEKTGGMENFFTLKLLVLGACLFGS